MKKILYVLHSGTTGGTFLTTEDLMKNIEKKYDIFLLSAERDFLKLFYYSNKNLKLIEKYPRKNKWSAKKFHDSWLTFVYFDILINFNIDLVHIRHLINHSFDLPYIAKKLNIPVVVSIHDFYLICPFYTLLDENAHYCGGVCNSSLENCYNSLEDLNDIHSKKIIPIWRDEVNKLINNVDCFISTSQFVKDLCLYIYPNILDSTFKIIEHGRDFPKLNKIYYEVPNNSFPVKILCPANYLNTMKGSEFIKKLKLEDTNNKLDFHFLGNCRDNVEEFGVNHGTYPRNDFHKKVGEIKPSFIGIFSIWPETYCHTLTESWSCGVPVLGSNLGVIQDRIIQNGGGWILDINNPHDSYLKILSIIDDKEEYEKVTNIIKNFSFKSTKKMSKEYVIIYEKLISGETINQI